jgi:hypothetical protein
MVLSGGKYETGQSATWGEGDWTDDDRFDFDDIFASLVTGYYETDTYAVGWGGGTGQTNGVPEPSGGALVVCSLMALAAACRLSLRKGEVDGIHEELSTPP